MTDAVVWLVLWFVFMVVGVVVGQLVGFLGSFAAIAEDRKGMLLITVPVGLLGFGFAVLSLIHVILQIIDIVTRVMA